MIPHAPMAAYGYRHGSGGGGVLTFLAHAAIWHVVGQVIYRLPLPLAIGLGVAACLGLLVSRRRRARR